MNNNNNNQHAQGDGNAAEYDELYRQLPRFVGEGEIQTETGTGSRKVSFNWQGSDYELIIHPAQIQIDGQEDKYLLLGKRERIVDLAITLLSRNRTHFDPRTAVVTFTSRELAEAIRENCGTTYSDRELEEAIAVLAHTQYRLLSKGEMFAFFSLDPVRQKTDGETLIFQVRPTGLIFGDRLQTLRNV